MKEFIWFLVEITNEVHDVLVSMFGAHLNDKQLHFWVIGVIGIITFILVYLFFKMIENWKFHTTIISFIFTFVGMVVLVFAIEIQQALTNRGQMEFADAVAGLWGFLVFFFVYAIIAFLFYYLFLRIRKRKRKR